MDWARRRRGRVAVLALPVFLAAAAAAAQTPMGGEFQVNTRVPGQYDRYPPEVAADSQGRFVVVWARNQPGLYTVRGQRFDADGTPLGSEFLINTGSVSPNDHRPDVAFEANGGFVVVWGGRPPVGGGVDVVARRYDSAGVPRGPEFLVAATTGQIIGPRVSAGAGGGFVVTWRDYSAAASVRARLYDASGVGQAIIDVAPYSGSVYLPDRPDVTVTPDGGFVSTWAPDAQPSTVWARRYGATGVPAGPAFAVSTGSAFKHQTRIASDGTGNFTVVWHDAPAGYADNVVARKFAADSTPLTGEIVPNTFTPGFQGSPSVAMTPEGDVIVAWSGGPGFPNCPPPPLPCPPLPPAQDGSESGIIGRRLDPSGAFLGGEFIANAYTTGFQESPTVAADAMGRYIVAWADPDRNGIYARRFSGLVPAALAVDRVPSASDGNGVLEPGETAIVEPSWRNTTATAITYAGASATLAGPPGPAYATPDPAADYGTLPAGAVRGCRDQGDCYAASISGARPAAHWDAVLTEGFLPAGQGPSKPWAIHVGESFADVPRANAFYRFVETVFHNDVMGGCAPGFFCATFNVPREHMPLFVLSAYQPAFLPPACVAGSELFADVPASSPYCPWIEELARRGVVAGCGGGNYCPTLTISRETMAVYLLATMGVSPPACGATPMFTDVPASSPFCRWIEELARRAVVGGCGPGTYCPTLPVARDQMSVFLTVTYGLTLYGP